MGMSFSLAFLNTSLRMSSSLLVVGPAKRAMLVRSSLNWYFEKYGGMKANARYPAMTITSSPMMAFIVVQPRFLLRGPPEFLGDCRDSSIRTFACRAANQLNFAL